MLLQMCWFKSAFDRLSRSFTCSLVCSSSLDEAFAMETMASFIDEPPAVLQTRSVQACMQSHIDWNKANTD